MWDQLHSFSSGVEFETPHGSGKMRLVKRGHAEEEEEEESIWWTSNPGMVGHHQAWPTPERAQCTGHLSGASTSVTFWHSLAHT